jgi:hypothetical protein
MEQVKDQVILLANESDASRQKVMKALQDLLFSFETTEDTIHRYGHMVGQLLQTSQSLRLTSDKTLQSAVVQAGINLGLFKYLSQHGKPLTVDEISEKCKTDRQLMGKLKCNIKPGYESQCWSSSHLEISECCGSSSRDRKASVCGKSCHRQPQRRSCRGWDITLVSLTYELVLSTPYLIIISFSTASPPAQSLPDFLEQIGYTNPVAETHTAFKLAFNTDLNAYAWFGQNPTQLNHFNTYMALRRNPDSTWLSVYPVAEEAAAWPSEKPLYVNIGGGVGHQCAQFREKYPDLPGRIVLQDLPHSVAQALPTPGVENMAHNILEPQPVVGMLSIDAIFLRSSLLS